MVSGDFGCTFCHVDGEQDENNRLVRYYPADRVAPRRSHDDIVNDMEVAEDTGTITRGVKGKSALYHLRHQFNFSTGVVVDCFHNIYHGVTKKITNFYFDKDSPFYIGNVSKGTVNERLGKIVFPSHISRRQRLIDDLKQFKGTEFRNWLIYVAPVVLYDVLPRGDHSLVVKLSEAIFLLNQHSVSEAQVRRAEELLQDFNRGFNERFTTEAMSYNLHIMLHIVYGVLCWGNIWVYSGAIFEAYNMKIIRNVTAANGRCDQVVKRYLLMKFLEDELENEGITLSARVKMREYLHGSKWAIPPDTSTGRSFRGKTEITTSAATENEKEIIRAGGINILENVRLTRFNKADIHGVEFEVNFA